MKVWIIESNSFFVMFSPDCWCTVNTIIQLRKIRIIVNEISIWKRSVTTVNTEWNQVHSMCMNLSGLVTNSTYWCAYSTDQNRMPWPWREHQSETDIRQFLAKKIDHHCFKTSTNSIHPQFNESGLYDRWWLNFNDRTVRIRTRTGEREFLLSIKILRSIGCSMFIPSVKLVQTFADRSAWIEEKSEEIDFSDFLFTNGKEKHRNELSTNMNKWWSLMNKSFRLCRFNNELERQESTLFQQRSQQRFQFDPSHRCSIKFCSIKKGVACWKSVERISNSIGDSSKTKRHRYWSFTRSSPSISIGSSDDLKINGWSFFSWYQSSVNDVEKVSSSIPIVARTVYVNNEKEMRWNILWHFFFFTRERRPSAWSWAVLRSIIKR